MRNWLFDFNLRRAHAVEAKVISVGNLTLGGTGKTPITLALIDHIKTKGWTVGVVSRGYGRRNKGVLHVELGPSAATQFGDEPVLIKTIFPDIPVVVGEKRVIAARNLIESQKVQFVISDDSFQHRSLKRDLNLLLFDATENMKDYRVMPVGRGRESISAALRRADYFVITKINLAANDQLKDFIFWLKEKSNKPVLLAAYKFNGFESMLGEKVQDLKDKSYLVSGIAKPETIEATISGHVELVKHKRFADHHRYTHREVEAILDEASTLQARWIITTAKDATKLRQFHRLKERLWVIDLKIKFEGDFKVFYADIDRLARESH